jgi:pyridoxal phosphate enzyme (YggS family)
MQDVQQNLKGILQSCWRAAEAANRDQADVHLIAVSKNHSADHIRPALAAGHRIYGENRVQEAQGKWPELKSEYNDIELHLIGPLQSNKTADAVALFDVIHTIDREKIAASVATEIKKQGRKLRLYVQVNTGSEPQKAGIEPEETGAFVEMCRSTYGLAIEGLMCIPPVDENPGPHFALLNKLARQSGLKGLSMGMSADFETAIELGATYVRVGSAIFGSRS